MLKSGDFFSCNFGWTSHQGNKQYSRNSGEQLANTDPFEQIIKLNKLKLLIIVFSIIFFVFLVWNFTLKSKSCNDGNGKECYSQAEIERKKNNLGRAKELCTKACNNDYLDGCSNLGALEKADKNFESSTYYFQKACTGGNPIGCYNLGSNQYFSHNINEALKNYILSCEKGIVQGCLSSAHLFEESSRSKETIKYFKDVCENKDSTINFRSKGCFGAGYVIQKHLTDLVDDLSDAMKFYSLACKYGDQNGCHAGLRIKDYVKVVDESYKPGFQQIKDHNKKIVNMGT